MKDNLSFNTYNLSKIDNKLKVNIINNVDFEELSLSEAVTIISENPQILRRPIIMDDKRLHIGYNEEEIRAFLPRSVRVLENDGLRLRDAI